MSQACISLSGLYLSVRLVSLCRACISLSPISCKLLVGTVLESEQRRVADATCQASKRALESDSDTEQRRTADTFRVAKKRALETQEQSEQRKTADRVRKANKKHLERCSLQSVIDSFITKTKHSPDYVCTSFAIFCTYR